MLRLKEVVFGLLLCFGNQVYQSKGFVFEEYYWQDYEGDVPPEAFAGGQDANGRPVYIGQVLYFSKLMPAKIYGNERKAYIAWGSEITVEKDIKILCAKNPENFKWVPTRKDEVHKLFNHRLIKGGTEPSYDLYIGRAFYKQQTLVGRVRVFGPPVSNLGLYLSADGKEVILDSFEILTYVPDKNATDIRYCGSRVVVLRQ